MKRSAISFVFFCFVTIFVFASFASAQNFTAKATLHQPTDASADANSTGTNDASIYTQPRLIGFFSAEGKYQPARVGPNGETVELTDAVPNPPVVARSARVASDVSVVENYAPPAHASETVKGPSLLSTLRDNLITWAFGHSRVLQDPTHVATDSQGRLIVADPQLRAVHVLDPAQKASFRICGGPTRRLQSPGSIAVDAQDRIYVADLALHLISVYEPDGRFIRYIGEYGGETMFDMPGAIAIDKESGKLYVLDTPADELVVMNLDGKVLRRAGNGHTRGKLGLVHPSEITLWKERVFVLDMFGSRVQVLDSDLQPVASFNVRSPDEPPLAREVGMAVDQHGNLYLSNLVLSRVLVFSPQGRFVTFLGKQEPAPGYSPFTGIWVDGRDRLFLCDNIHARVQIFQIGSTDSPVPAVRN